MAGFNIGNRGSSTSGAALASQGAGKPSGEQQKLDRAQGIDSAAKPVIEGSDESQKGLPDGKVEEVQNDNLNALNQAFAEEAAGKAGVTEETEGTVYSSHPVQNFSVGRFHFNKATLTLRDPADIEEFDKLVAGIPAPSRILIKKIDKEAAGRIAAAHFQAAAQRGMGDSAAGREALKKLQDKTGTVGVEELNAALGAAGNQFANRAGEDENFGIHPTAAELAGRANAEAEAKEAEQKNS